MQYRTPFICIVILITLLIFYFTRKRLPLKSTNLFSKFLILSFINMFFEILTLYTIYHVDPEATSAFVHSQTPEGCLVINVAPWVNRFCHQIFIGSLDITIYYLFLYVDARANKQRRNSRPILLIINLPLIISVVMVILGKLYYTTTPTNRYSYGPMANTIYISVALYVIGVVYLLLKHKDQFRGGTWKTIIIGVSIWVFIAIYQMIYPTSLISSIGIILMVLSLFLSFENPRDFNDIEIEGVMNTYAFDLMLSEFVESGKEFFLVTFTLTNDKVLKNSIGYKDIPNILDILSKQQYRLTKEMAYHVNENTICILCRDSGIYTALLNNSSSSIKYKNENGILFTPEYFTTILSVPTYAKSRDEILNVLDYIREEGVHEQSNGLLIINDTIINEIKRLTLIEMLIQDAIEHDGFEVYYQPIYSTHEKSFLSAEALVRLKDKKTNEYISPEIFIPIAERQGMIKQLGLIVFEKVCNFSSKNNLAQKGIKYIEINISGIQGVDESLPELLSQIMDKYHIAPSFINLEITETASITAGEMLIHNLKKLQDLGCGLSMDDFGTGYSNLSKMIKNRFDLIKLDKSLIWPCFEDDNQDALILLESCIDLIQKLGFHIVAEGIESEEQSALLIQKGISYIQGFFYSHPIPEEKFLEFITNNNKSN